MSKTSSALFSIIGGVMGAICGVARSAHTVGFSERRAFRAALVLLLIPYLGGGLTLHAEGRLPWWSAVTLVSGQAADVASTCAALGTNRAVEGNALLPNNCTGIGSVKLAASSAILYSGVRLARTQPKKATALMVIVGAIGWAAMAHNAMVLQRIK